MDVLFLVLVSINSSPRNTLGERIKVAREKNTKKKKRKPEISKSHGRSLRFFTQRIARGEIHLRTDATQRGLCSVHSEMSNATLLLLLLLFLRRVFFFCSVSLLLFTVNNLCIYRLVTYFV